MSTYAYLGPVGTFTEAALKKITTAHDSRVPYANVTAALDAVRTGEADYALVPIENSVEGVVARTLDELATGAPLVIAGEVTLPVTFALMSLPGRTQISTIATHPHAEAQCRTYIAQRYPHAELVSTSSTAAAAQALSRGEFDAAIASSAAAEHFGLSIDIDHAGALLEILTVFADHNVNLTFIQSRPTGRELGHYHFIIDVEGHCQDEPVATSLSELGEICDEIRFLGSYPREARK